MILGPVTLIDCAVFVFFLIPQLWYQAGLGATFVTVIQVLPFLIIVLPYQFLKERYFTVQSNRSPFVQRASIFQDVVIRCVRYAFANIPAKIGRVFFSKAVAYPFFCFRMLRNGYLSSPIKVAEVHKNGIRGLWISYDSVEKPDLVIYYCHGGGFSMGSAYFYLEFLIAWLSRLHDHGFHNPAIFALEYTLVPDAVWPTQFSETCAGYRLLHDYMGGDSSRICVSGDSAGATLILSRILHHGDYDEVPIICEASRPALAVLISPWTHLISPLNRNTPSDYLDADALEKYGAQYLGGQSLQNDLISPGLMYGRWKLASPTRGYCIVYGAEEVFAPAIEETMRKMKDEGARVMARREEGGIHAWPVVDLFLGATREERLGGLDQITEMVVSRMGGAVQVGETTKKKMREEATHSAAYPSNEAPTPSVGNALS